MLLLLLSAVWREAQRANAESVGDVGLRRRSDWLTRRKSDINCFWLLPRIPKPQQVAAEPNFNCNISSIAVSGYHTFGHPFSVHNTSTLSSNLLFHSFLFCIIASSNAIT